MQRVNEADVSGVIIENGMPYEHLCIPMEYDSARHCSTSIGWEDPRTEEGELAWPERFPPDVVAQTRYDIGDYAYCTPYEAPILMSDLSMRPIGEIKVGDEVIGYDPVGKTKGRRSRLRIAKVTAISKSQQQLVKITLESGAVVRCTPDHKWYTGRNDSAHTIYKAASVGSPLMRVCDDKIRVLTDPEEIRLAGWLAGFFDGEGSITNAHKGISKSCLISFTQGTDRNFPLCLGPRS